MEIENFKTFAMHSRYLYQKTNVDSFGKYHVHRMVIEKTELTPVWPNKVTFAIFSGLEAIFSHNPFTTKILIIVF